MQMAYILADSSGLEVLIYIVLAIIYVIAQVISGIAKKAKKMTQGRPPLPPGPDVSTRGRPSPFCTDAAETAPGTRIRGVAP